MAVSASERGEAEYPQGDASPLIEHFAAGSARGLVEAQKVLDEHARQSLSAWEQEGIPPSAWTWAECRLRFPVVYGLESKTTLADHTRLSLAPRKKGAIGSVSLTIRYLPPPLEEEPY